MQNDSRRIPIRHLCTYCGAWREADAIHFVMALSEGFLAGSKEEKEEREAQKKEGPFMIKHLEECGPKGGVIIALRPNESRWAAVDLAKQEI